MIKIKVKAAERKSMRLKGKIVTYDPIRRKGFLEVWGEQKSLRVHFVLRVLPEDIKQEVIEASREINRAKKEKNLSGEEFKKICAEVTALVMGKEFSFEVKQQDGKLIIRNRSMEHLSAE